MDGDRKWMWIVGGILAVVGGIWWYNTESSFAPLTDGVYSCQAVYVNAEGKYQVLADDNNQRFSGNARIEGGEVVSVSAPAVLGWPNQPDWTVTNSGRNDFRITEPDSYSQNRYALACAR